MADGRFGGGGAEVSINDTTLCLLLKESQSSNNYLILFLFTLDKYLANIVLSVLGGKNRHTLSTLSSVQKLSCDLFLVSAHT